MISLEYGMRTDFRIFIARLMGQRISHSEECVQRRSHEIFNHFDPIFMVEVEVFLYVTQLISITIPKASTAELNSTFPIPALLTEA
jgi:hypothetical protein